MWGFIKRSLSYKKGYICLLYHRIVDKDKEDRVVNWSTRVRKVDFLEQMQFLKSYSTTIPLKEIAERIKKNILPNRFYVAVSFDDGYIDNYTEAYPIIQNLGIPITVFLTTGFIEEPQQIPWWDLLERVALDNHGRITITVRKKIFRLNLDSHQGRLKFFRVLSNHIKRNPGMEHNVLKSFRSYFSINHNEPNEFMRWDHVHSMASCQLVDFASHTCWHQNLASVLPSVYNEIQVSQKRILQKIGAVENIFSYPFGGINIFNAKKLIDYLKHEGMKAAFTTTPGNINTSHHHFLLPRIPISGRDNQTLFLVKILSPGLMKFIHQLRNNRRAIH